jgi:hypothetical protein
MTREYRAESFSVSTNLPRLRQLPLREGELNYVTQASFAYESTHCLLAAARQQPSGAADV